MTKQMTFEEAKKVWRKMADDYIRDVERANKKPWHAPELRKHGTLTERTGDLMDFPDDPFCS